MTNRGNRKMDGNALLYSTTLHLLFATICISLLFAGTAAAAWQERLAGRGTSPSLTIDAHGVSHVVLINEHDNALVHVSYGANGSMTKETIPVSQPHNVSIATDKVGNLHMALTTGGTPGSLQYTVKHGKTWSSYQAVDPLGAFSVKIATGPDNQPHIAYSNGQSLMHASFDGTNWTIEEIPTGPYGAAASAIVVADDGTVHIAYANLAVCDAIKPPGGGWTNSCTGDGGFYPSLALNLKGMPHLSYTTGNAYTGDLRYAHLTDSGWIIETIDSEAIVQGSVNGSAIAVDASGIPKITYIKDNGAQRDPTTWAYATKSTGSWQITAIDHSPLQICCAGLALDSAGLAHAMASSDDLVVYGSLPQPDMTARWLDLTQSLNPKGGLIVSGHLNVINQGNSPANGFKVSYYLSADDSLDASDTLLSSQKIGVLAGRATDKLKFSFKPAGSVSGQFIIASLTSGSPQKEASVANNIAVQMVP